MKRNKEKVPEFDEIIFANRNKTYGAYDLRKRYKSAASISLFGAITIGAILIFALSLTTEKGKASTGIKSLVIVMTNPVPNDFVPPEIPKPPAALTNIINNLKPEVTEDTSEVTKYIPTAQEIQEKVQNGNPVDTAKFTPVPDPVIPDETDPPVWLEEMPEFPGGMAALQKYIIEQINYPSDALINNIQGKVFLKFVVKADGSVDRIMIIRGVDPLLDNEAIRVVKMLPRFKPGRQNGVPAQVWFSLPVNFKLEKN
jgi:periplasmic protein TonB